MKSRGTIIIAVVFLLFLAFSGLALLTQTITHLQIVRFREQTFSQREHLNREMIVYLHGLRQRVFGVDLNEFSEPAVDFFNLSFFPDFESNSIRYRHSFKRREIFWDSHYCKTRVAMDIGLILKKPVLAVWAQAISEVVWGDIPIHEFPVLIDKKIVGSPDSFLLEKNFFVDPHYRPVVGEVKTSGDALHLVLDVLHLSGECLKWRELRERLHLAPGDEPIARGIYPCIQEDRVEAVFVQGDLEKIVFGASQENQAVTFFQEGHSAGFSYIPGQHRFIFAPLLQDSLCFSEKIIVNGNIGSIEQTGECAFASDSHIDLICAGRVTFTSDLWSAPPDQRKSAFSHLTVVTSARDFFDHHDISADIAFFSEKAVRIQANLISAGRLVNRGSDVKIEGSVYARDIENQARIEFNPVASRNGDIESIRIVGFKFLKSFFINFIREGDDE